MVLNSIPINYENFINSQLFNVQDVKKEDSSIESDVMRYLSHLEILDGHMLIETLSDKDTISTSNSLLLKKIL